MNPQKKVVEHLRQLNIDHEIVPCDPVLADTAAFCEAYGFSPLDSANTIVVVAKGHAARHVACVVLASHRLDVNGLVRRRLEVRKASFATADQTIQLTGMEIGGVTLFGLPEDLPIWVDAAVMQREQIIIGGGSRAIKVLLRPEELPRVANLTVVTDLAVVRE